MLVTQFKNRLAGWVTEREGKGVALVQWGGGIVHMEVWGRLGKEKEEGWNIEKTGITCTVGMARVIG